MRGWISPHRSAAERRQRQDYLRKDKITDDMLRVFEDFDGMEKVHLIFLVLAGFLASALSTLA